MRIEWDREADAAYIYLVDSIGAGGVALTDACDSGINLDFDSEDRLIGVEVLDASRRLPEKLLDQAK